MRMHTQPEKYDHVSRVLRRATVWLSVLCYNGQCTYCCGLNSLFYVNGSSWSVHAKLSQRLSSDVTRIQKRQLQLMHCL